MQNVPMLILESNRSHLKLESLALADESYDIRTASNAGDALKLLAEFQPKIILMGLELPDMNGLDFVRQLKADPRYRDIAIIVITAHAMPGDESAALQAGCVGYISKPIEVETFPQVIHDYIVKNLEK